MAIKHAKVVTHANSGADGTQAQKDDWNADHTGADFVQIAQFILGSDTASFDFTSIPSTYRDLRVSLLGRSTKASVSTDGVRMRFNNDSSALYYSQEIYAASSTLAGNSEVAQTSANLGAVGAATAPANYADAIAIEIANYAGTTFHKTARIPSHGGMFVETAFNFYVYSEAIWWKSTAAINQITIYPAGGNWKTGSVATLFGIGT